MTTSDAVEPDGAGNALCRDLVLMCADSGALVAVTTGIEPRPSWVRVVVFLASGETYGLASPAGSLRGRRFELAWSEADGRQQVQLSANAGAPAGPAELSDGDPPAAGPRVPLGVDVTLEPLSMPVATDDARSPNSAMAAQGFRMAGSLAVGSVLHPLAGQGWASRSGFSAPATESGVRIQAAFQDGSGLLATRAGREQGSAALLVRTRTSTLPLRRVQVSGPDRGPSTGVECALGGRSLVEVVGKLRHPDQHLAFVRPSRSGDGWTRVGYTPLDFVRSGVTGFGLVEQVRPVAVADAPHAGVDDLPDPF